jgi:cellulose synthase (UDP-forming)
VGLLDADPSLAYVQTIKTAVVSEGDPFNNLETLFYEGMMLARHDTNAVFPCGSGLAWRRAALEDIGFFPTWSLVEDLMSGIEALKRGWRSAYLPINGALAQHAPEDIPNVYKQRGTWALDTMRILFWVDLTGLNFRQRLQFAQMAVFYLHSFATLIFVGCLSFTLYTDRYPFLIDGSEAAMRFWPLIISTEIFLVALHAGHPLERVWRLREMAVGLSPLYAVACVRALFGGPDHRYVYRVTRKVDRHQWYWQETLPQVAMLLVLGGGIVYSVLSREVWTSVDAGLLYLALWQALPLAGFVRKGWHGTAGPLGFIRRRQLQIESSRVPASGMD